MDRDTLIYLLSSGSIFASIQQKLKLKVLTKEDEEEMVGGAAVADSDETPVEALLTHQFLETLFSLKKYQQIIVLA